MPALVIVQQPWRLRSLRCSILKHGRSRSSGRRVVGDALGLIVFWPIWARSLGFCREFRLGYWPPLWAKIV